MSKENWMSFVEKCIIKFVFKYTRTQGNIYEVIILFQMIASSKLTVSFKMDVASSPA